MKLNWIFKAIIAGVVQGLAQSAIEKRLSNEEDETPTRKRTAKK